MRYRISIACSDWFLRPVAVNGTRSRANDRATSRPKSYVSACSVTVRFYELWHDQSLEGRISCTTKAWYLTIDRSWLVVQPWMTDGTTYVRLMVRPICESESQVRSFEHVQKPCLDRFCQYDRPRPLRQVVRCFCDLSTIVSILDRALVVTWS